METTTSDALRPYLGDTPYLTLTNEGLLPEPMSKNTMHTQGENDDMQGEITLVNRECKGPRDTSNQEEHHDRDHGP